MADTAITAPPTSGAIKQDTGIIAAIFSRLVIIVPYLWLLIFFLVPFFIVFKISLSQTAIAMPPYTPVVSGIGDLFAKLKDFSFDNYVWLTDDPL